MSISQTITSLSSRGFSEQSPFDSSSGSIGITWPGKYTELPRAWASTSSALPTVT